MTISESKIPMEPVFLIERLWSCSHQTSPVARARPKEIDRPASAERWLNRLRKIAKHSDVKNVKAIRKSGI